MRALQNKLSVEALPAQPLPGALDISSQAELVYYGIKTMGHNHITVKFVFYKVCRFFWGKADF